MGVAVGLVLGFIIGSSRFLYNACYPLLVISAMAMVMYELFAQLEKRMTGCFFDRLCLGGIADYHKFARHSFRSSFKPQTTIRQAIV